MEEELLNLIYVLYLLTWLVFCVLTIRFVYYFHHNLVFDIIDRWSFSKYFLSLFKYLSILIYSIILFFFSFILYIINIKDFFNDTVKNFFYIYLDELHSFIGEVLYNINNPTYWNVSEVFVFKVFFIYTLVLLLLTVINLVLFFFYNTFNRKLVSISMISIVSIFIWEFFTPILKDVYMNWSYRNDPLVSNIEKSALKAKSFVDDDMTSLIDKLRSKVFTKNKNKANINEKVRLVRKIIRNKN